MTACAQCGATIDILRPGRIARYCSTKCRMKAYRARLKERG